ncbi:unnamed protein product [Soboliphyme baturini]|uniref:Uncharacterized protein n=1 Tax=Soboliphyme baturini TaxID=241478 RepID=A0A183IGV7_9BILA|nr:unnamed protein product [Soboliphyme baturini]
MSRHRQQCRSENEDESDVGEGEGEGNGEDGVGNNDNEDHQGYSSFFGAFDVTFPQSLRFIDDEDISNNDRSSSDAHR